MNTAIRWTLRCVTFLALLGMLPMAFHSSPASHSPYVSSLADLGTSAVLANINKCPNMGCSGLLCVRQRGFTCSSNGTSCSAEICRP